MTGADGWACCGCESGLGAVSSSIGQLSGLPKDSGVTLSIQHSIADRDICFKCFGVQRPTLISPHFLNQDPAMSRCLGILPSLAPREVRKYTVVGESRRAM